MTRRRHIRPHDAVRLGAPRRYALYTTTALLFASGAVWLWVHWRRADDALPSPLEPWTMKLHGGAAMLLLYLAGTLLYGHMATAWRRRTNRLSGSLVASGLAALAVSGYGLYYFGGDALRAGTEWLHWVIGVVTPLLVWWHVARGRAGRVQRAANGAGPQRRLGGVPAGRTGDRHG